MTGDSGPLAYDPGSFRDPSGRVFRSAGRIFREMDQASHDNFIAFRSSPVYDRLVRDRSVVWSREAQAADFGLPADRRVVEHEKIPFISYCYEWSPSMLAEAGRFVVGLQARLLEHGFSLKDATPYNVQFVGGRPVWIDIASIRPWDGKPAWVAYSQFCRYFLYPLLLVRYRGLTVRQLLLADLEGVAFEDALKRLPLRAKLNPRLFTDLAAPVLLGRLVSEEASQRIIVQQKASPLAKEIQQRNLARLGRLVGWARPSKRSFWSGYEETKSYDDQSERQKDEFVRRALAGDGDGCRSVIDVGCNTGRYSRLAAEALPGARVVAVDFDVESVDRVYLNSRDGQPDILPLVVDLTNPSPALGWRLAERPSFLERADFDAVLALAVIHHLRVGKNIPLDQIAGFLSGLAGRRLIIEFVAKDDPMWKRLTAIREDVYGDYDQANFEAAFGRRLVLKDKLTLAMGSRTVYHYEKPLSRR